MEGMGIGIAVTSYDGSMNFGFNADPDIIPNLDLFAEMMRRSLERVAKEAGVELTTAQRKPRAKRPDEAPRVNGNGSAAPQK